MQPTISINILQSSIVFALKSSIASHKFHKPQSARASYAKLLVQGHLPYKSRRAGPAELMGWSPHALVNWWYSGLSPKYLVVQGCSSISFAYLKLSMTKENDANWNPQSNAIQGKEIQNPKKREFVTRLQAGSSAALEHGKSIYSIGCAAFPLSVLCGSINPNEACAGLCVEAEGFISTGREAVGRRPAFCGSLLWIPWRVDPMRETGEGW